MAPNSTRRRLGFEIPLERPLDENADLCVWAEQAGFDDAWYSQISDPDAFVQLALAAVKTNHLRLGTAIVPIGPRSAPSLAASSASVAAVSANRFMLGIGVSSKVIVERWNGVHYGKPLGTARETITLLRHLFGGGRSDLDGDYVQSKGFRLRQPPTGHIPIALAALNVRMLELAGEIADAVYLNFVPISAAQTVIEAVSRGAERGGRDELPELILTIPCEVTGEVDRAKQEFARSMAFYFTVPPYQKAFTWYGFGADVARAQEAWVDRDLSRVQAAISSDFLDSLGVFGTVEQCRARFEETWAAGIGTVAAVMLSGGPIRPTLDALAGVLPKSERSGSAAL
jgi:probable F420-dependent oxidoreductase